MDGRGPGGLGARPRDPVRHLVGSRGFRDNLEIPLSYTIVGMPLALLVWMLLNRTPRIWQAAVITATRWNGSSCFRNGREFAERPVYLGIMETMIDQGTEPLMAPPTRDARWIVRTLGL